MLQNWLKPLTATTRKSIDQLPDSAFGKNIALHGLSFPDLSGVRVALIGAGDREASAVRAALYRTAYNFPAGAVVDLGNLRRAEPSVLIPVFFELLSGNILPVLLAQKNDLARAQFLAYLERKSLVNLVAVDESIQLSDADAATDSRAAYSPLLQPRHPLLFHFGLVGFQTHQTEPRVVDFLTKNNFDLLRLGKTRASIEEAEPILRDADLLTFHLSALKQSEAPGVAQPSPSGYFVEEACQICRYAGMSDKLSSFGIFGYQQDQDPHQQTAQAISQMVWYFLEGFFNRKNDYPASKDGLTEYIVDFRHLNHQLTFWKSTKSGRWWMQTPANPKEKYQRHYLIPCSYQDYQAACREELSDRLLQALNRFD
ncbi:MAG: arginase family protein [Lewinellaceae bacterium]|nr:arginase family protein [Saprospiraceae bacterium]MCB9314665.1 arginase family protein [Lewinellaceae bacterium]MCB9334210.1 arginase family protein [Lewinellaceae bacterium]